HSPTAGSSIPMRDSGRQSFLPKLLETFELRILVDENRLAMKGRRRDPCVGDGEPATGPDPCGGRENGLLARNPSRAHKKLAIPAESASGFLRPSRYSPSPSSASSAA